MRLKGEERALDHVAAKPANVARSDRETLPPALSSREASDTKPPAESEHRYSSPLWGTDPVDR